MYEEVHDREVGIVRNRFDDQLHQLNDELIEMGELVIKAIENAVTAFMKNDRDIAKNAEALEEQIDQKERDIESLCLKLLLQQQPVASDLRLISSALKMITDLERIGDQAEDISNLVLLMSGKPHIKEPEDIDKMAKATVKMVKESTEAFVKRDVDLALEVCDHDARVNELFYIVKNDLIEIIHKSPENGEQAIELLMVAKYFERIGDHAVNVAEWVIFSITGKKKE